MEWYWLVIAGLPACYYGGVFWTEVIRRLLGASLILVGVVAKAVALSADWLSERLV